MELPYKATEFSFVISTPSHNASARRETQLFVRQHVNRRFKRNKDRPHKVVLHKKPLAEHPARENPPESGGGDEHNVVSMGSPSNAAALLGASRPNPFARYPVKMGVKEHEFIHFIWASRQIIFQPFRDYWFSLGMVDPAAMHLVLANAATHRKTLRTNPEDDYLALSHTTQAIASINKRISNPDLNSTDGILGAVLGLYCHDSLARNFEQCNLHLKGFLKMVQIRGGMTSIDSKIPIRMTVFWIDHNSCAAQDIIPQLPPPYHLLSSPYSTPIRARGQLHCDETVASIGISDLTSPEVLDVLRGLSTLTVSFKGRSVQKMSLEDPNFPGFAFYPELYNLLSMQANRPENAVKSALQELIRLGGLLFLAEVRRILGVWPVVTDVQASKLHELLASESALWSQELDSLRTWVIVMAGCAASTPADRTWATVALTYTHKFTIYRSWEDIYKIVSKMWWIDAIFALNCFTNSLFHETGFQEQLNDQEALQVSSGKEFTTRGNIVRKNTIVDFLSASV